MIKKDPEIVFHYGEESYDKLLNEIINEKLKIKFKKTGLWYNKKNNATTIHPKSEAKG